MTKNPNSNVVSDTKALYAANPLARRFLDSLASRSRARADTKADWLANSLGVAEEDARDILRSLADAGCGEYVVGRRGGKTRLVWEFNSIAVGKAASGQPTELKPYSDDDEEDYAEIILEAPKAVEPLMTIGLAKRLLAEALGVNEANIEITVRA
jgi:hypothetical protein